MAAEDDRPPFYNTTVHIGIFHWMDDSTFNFERERPSPLTITLLENHEMVLDVQFGTASCWTAYPASAAVARAVVFLFEWPDELKYPIGLKLRAKWIKCGSIIFLQLVRVNKGIFQSKIDCKISANQN